ncbi:Rhodanese-like protein [Fomes fomentarius]|nr:Rhodanese-like protein [Fomes fomentarius]
MLRSVLARSATLSRSAACARIPIVSSRVALQLVRYESSKVPDEKKKQLEAQNDLLRDWDAKIITYEELKPKTLQPSPDKYLIDVREPDEVLQGSIPSAVNLPLSVISTALHLPPAEFKEKYGFEKPRQDQELTFYCRSGVRSASAADVAKRNGYTNLINYKGSWLDWTGREGKNAA